MTIRRVITGGCSFSEHLTKQSWIYRLQEKLEFLKLDITFRHTGFNGQGQELIQKKLSLALYEELQTYKPEEILVLPMWSGTDRKAFYIDNKELVEEIAQEWIRKKLFGSQQFFNLKNLAEKNDVVTCSKTNNFVLYNKEGGWYNCHYFTPDSQLSKEFFRSMDKVVGFATYSLENIIFLQNLCTLFGVKIFHSFYRNHVYNDIAQNKNHLNLKYLYSMLKHDNIISTTGIYEYLKSDQKMNKPSLQLFHDIVINLYSPEKNKEYFEEDNMHPNQKGHQKWVDEVLFPALQTKGIF